jgi:hypothetical protein
MRTSRVTFEGLTVVDSMTLAVSNDNDFGLTDNPTWDADGNLTSDTGVRNQILYVRLANELPKK